MNQEEKQSTSQVKVTVQCPPFLFVVASGMKCSWAPGCSCTVGKRKDMADPPVGSLMFCSLMPPALNPLKQDCHSKLKMKPSLSSSS